MFRLTIPEFILQERSYDEPNDDTDAILLQELSSDDNNTDYYTSDDNNIDGDYADLVEDTFVLIYEGEVTLTYNILYFTAVVRIDPDRLEVEYYHVAPSYDCSSYDGLEYYRVDCTITCKDGILTMRSSYHTTICETTIKLSAAAVDSLRECLIEMKNAINSIKSEYVLINSITDGINIRECMDTFDSWDPQDSSEYMSSYAAFKEFESSDESSDKE